MPNSVSREKRNEVTNQHGAGGGAENPNNQAGGRMKPNSTNPIDPNSFETVANNPPSDGALVFPTDEEVRQYFEEFGPPRETYRHTEVFVSERGRRSEA